MSQGSRDKLENPRRKASLRGGRGGCIFWNPSRGDLYTPHGAKILKKFCPCTRGICHEKCLATSFRPFQATFLEEIVSAEFRKIFFTAHSTGDCTKKIPAEGSANPLQTNVQDMQSRFAALRQIRFRVRWSCPKCCLHHFGPCWFSTLSASTLATPQFQRKTKGDRWKTQGRGKHTTKPLPKNGFGPPHLWYVFPPPFVHAMSFPLEGTGTDQTNPTFGALQNSFWRAHSHDTFSPPKSHDTFSPTISRFPTIGGVAKKWGKGDSSVCSDQTFHDFWALFSTLWWPGASWTEPLFFANRVSGN